MALPVLAGPIPQPEIQSWSEAAEHEKLLQADTGNTRIRSLLLGWYTRNYRDSRAKTPRFRHIFYSIAHFPAMFLIDSRSLRVAEDENEFPQARQAWMAAVARNPGDPIVKIRAAQTLMRSDRELAARWLRQVIREARKHEPLPDPPPFPGSKAPWWSWGQVAGDATRTLGQLLTDAIAGVTTRSPWEATGPVDPAIRASAFAAASLDEINRTNDAVLVAESAWWLHLTSESWERDGHPDRRFVPLAWRWFQRLESTPTEPFSRNGYIDAFQRYWSRLVPQTVPVPLPRTRRTVRPLNAAAPECPDGPEVFVEVIVAPDGHARFVNFLGGPPGSERTVSQMARSWRFPPSDGMEVQTTVPVRICPGR